MYFGMKSYLKSNRNHIVKLVYWPKKNVYICILKTFLKIIFYFLFSSNYYFLILDHLMCWY